MKTSTQNPLDDAIKAFPIEQVLDHLPDTVFFIKDDKGRYVAVNDTLVVRCGVNDKACLIGKTSSDVMGKGLGGGYEVQDRAIVHKGTAITDQLELHMYANKKIGWCITNKHPLFAPNGKVLGIVGISQDLRQPDHTHDDSLKLSTLLDYIKDNLSLAPTVRDLCMLVSMSPFQLDLRVKRIFGLTTGQWVLKQRMEFARQQLILSNDPIIEIALQAGYSDQSTFTRQFHKTTGHTPLQFRKSNLQS